MKINRSFGKASVRRIFNKRGALIIVGTCMIMALAILVVFIRMTKDSQTTQAKVEDCTPLVDSAKGLIKEKKYAEAYKKLSGEKARCNLAVDSSMSAELKEDKYLSALVYKGELAKAAYLSGDKDQAKLYAQEALTINKSISPEQAAKIQNQNAYMFDIYRMQNGTYREFGDTSPR